MTEIQFSIRFPDMSTAEAGKHASDLQRIIAEATDGEAHVTLHKERAETMDFGTILLVTLGTPAVIAVAQGLRDFIAKRGSKLEIRADGSVIASGDATRNIDVARVAEALKSARKR